MSVEIVDWVEGGNSIRKQLRASLEDKAGEGR